MDIKNLVTFIHVAELNSFTKAAEVMGYSQSTVSFQIRQLEKELNVQLFERINHTVMLTERGREVLAYAHEVERLTKDLQDGMRKEKNVSGYVRLAMADSLCETFLNDYRSFREEYPGISLKIVTAETGEMFRLVNHNEADLLLTLDSHIYNAEYVIAREEKINTHFVTAKNSPLAGKKTNTIRDLLEYPFILTEKGMSYRRLMDEKLAERSMEIRPVLELGNTRMICELLKRGLGVSFLPDFVTRRYVEAGELVWLNVKNFEIEIWKQLLYHRDKWVSPPMQTVIAYCAVREFGENIYGTLV